MFNNNKRRKITKKGQATVFVIIGILIMIVIGIGIYFLQNLSEKKVNIEEEYSQSIEQELVPVYDVVTSCLYSVSKKGLKILGLKGGNIETPEHLLYNINPSYKNNALQLYTESDLIIPYYVYSEDNPTCIECSTIIEIPSLDGNEYYSIKNQLQRYINTEVETCVKNTLTNINYEINYETPISEVFINENDVSIGLEYLIKLKTENSEAQINKFFVKQDLPLRKIHDLATDIIYNHELLDSFSERNTINMLEILSLNEEKSPIPPMNGPTYTKFDSPKYWMNTDVKNIIKSYLSETTSYVQIDKSKSSYAMFTPKIYKNNIYNSLNSDILTSQQELLSETKIRHVFFPTWDMYLNINPSTGELIMPKFSYTNLLFTSLGFVDYNFKYSMTYPILVTLEQDDYLDGDGYLYQFAYEVNIRNNQPYNTKINVIQTDSQNQEQVPELDKTEPVKIILKNGYTNQNYEDNITLTYTCTDLEIPLKPNENGIIEDKLPPCIQGYFSVINFDVGFKKQTEDIIGGRTNNFILNIYPEKEMEIALRTREITTFESVKSDKVDREWILTDNQPGIKATKYPEKEENIMMFFLKIEDDKPVKAKSLIINQNENKNKINLTPGIYELILTSNIDVQNNPVIIPKRTVNIEDEEIKLNGTTYNKTIMTGFLELKNNTMLEIKPQELHKNKRINVIYPTIDYNKFRDGIITDLVAYNILMTSPETQPNLFKPIFE
ncbi:hypothetical protein K9L67_03065 [Candidatus Woesearchaeota archaeon]|nr:hypothetical protein [Candidatus Woesearchaeota archaeon]MCF7901182.1 hypothetical protein [Candidatus Woesearchaeota archaeon]MCF8013804.1 hypothetical protein [Candidatus Woesearchaeota archaeon]